MRGFVGRVLVAGVLSVVPTAPGMAQGATAAACEPNQSTPAAVGRGSFFLARAFAAMKTGNPGKDLRDAISQLSDPKNAAANPVGTNLLLAQSYVLLLQTSGAGGVMRRGDIGLATNPEATINLYAAIDSSLKVVEARAPECVSTAAQWRQQAPWLNVTNQAINALNANKLDSAQLYANWSLMLSDRAPYAYSILAGVAKARNDHVSAMRNWQEALKSAGPDTAFNDVRLKTYYEMSGDAVARADAAVGPAKLAPAREAVTALRGYMDANPNDYQVTSALQNLTKMYTILGDTLSITQVYAPILKNPSQYGESTLLQAGVTATRFNRTADAARFFEAALQGNPYQRDALNNLAASYINEKRYDKVTPLVNRLIALDPNNPDNVLLYAYMYSGLLKQAKTPKDKKLYTDSLIFYSGKSEKMTMKVGFTEFSRGESEVTIGGSVENRGATAKSYTVYFEFLDKSGAVVASQQTTIGPVPPKDKKTFKVTVQGRNIVAYRYRPVT